MLANTCFKKSPLGYKWIGRWWLRAWFTFSCSLLGSGCWVAAVLGGRLPNSGISSVWINVFKQPVINNRYGEWSYLYTMASIWQYAKVFWQKNCHECLTVCAYNFCLIKWTSDNEIVSYLAIVYIAHPPTSMEILRQNKYAHALFSQSHTFGYIYTFSCSFALLPKASSSLSPRERVSTRANSRTRRTSESFPCSKCNMTAVLTTQRHKMTEFFSFLCETPQAYSTLLKFAFAFSQLFSLFSLESVRVHIKLAAIRWTKYIASSIRCT